MRIRLESKRIEVHPHRLGAAFLCASPAGHWSAALMAAVLCFAEIAACPGISDPVLEAPVRAGRLCRRACFS